MGTKVELLRKNGKPSKTKHGTPFAYTKHGCRCPPCGFAHSEYRAARYVPKPKRPPRHGTLHCYRKHKCKCEPCRAAKRDDYMKQKERRNGTLRDSNGAESAREQERAAVLVLQELQGQASSDTSPSTNKAAH